MNKTAIFFVILFILSLGYIVYFQVFELPKVKREAVFENIMQRKSVRSYDTNKIVSDEQTQKLLRAAMAAPTARNTQPWEFIVVKNRETLNKIADGIKSAQMLREASCAIVVLGNLERVGDMTYFWDQDTSAATENLLLEAEALGLGAVWIGVHSVDERVELIRSIFNLPQNVIPLNVISIGYPKGSEQPKDKWNPKNIHFEKY